MSPNPGSTLAQVTPLTLYEFDARFAAIFNQTSVGIAESDLSGRLLLVNPKYCEIVGRAESELLGLRMQDVTHPDDLPRELEFFQRMVETGAGFVIEKRCLKPDGSTVWVSNNVTFVQAPDQRPQYVLSVMQDISERKLSVEALYRSEKFARSIFESSTDCIKALDLEGRLIAMNAAGQKAMDIGDLESLLNTSWIEWWPTPAREHAQQAVAAARHGHTAEFTGFCPTVKGAPKWWHNTISPILDESGKPERLLVVTRDITEHYTEDQARDALIQAAVATGNQFFEALVGAMAKIFATRCAIVAERKPGDEGRARTLAVWMDGKLAENFEFELADCPSEAAVASGTSLVEENAQERFPGSTLLRGLQLESFFGKALPATTEDAIGLLAVLHDRRLDLNSRAEATLAIFAGRAGAELERVRSSRRLEERELLLRVVTNHAPILIAYIDREHRYRFCNDTHHKWFGVDRIAGMDVRTVVGDAAYRQLLPRLESALAGNEVTFEDFVPYPGGGRYVQTTYVPHRDADGGIHGLVAIAQDMTERHRAERATEFLAEANSLLSGSLNYEHTLQQITYLIVPSLADWCAVDVLKPDGELELLAALHWHPEKNRLIREMRRRHPLKLDSPVGVPLVARTGTSIVYEHVTEELLRQAAEDEDHFDMLARLYIKSAIIVPLKVRGRALAVLTLVSGESHYTFTGADLPLLEELARRCALVMENSRLYSEAQKEVMERARAEIALKEEAKRKDDFLAILGHELRNPLAPIRNCIDILERGRLSREQVKKTRETMARQVRHMSRLIDDLLDVSRFSQGKIPLDRREIDLVETVSETVRDHERSLHAKGLKLKLDFPAAPVWINGDAIRISQALINLLRNAESFSDPGGEISVSVREAAAFAEVRVADTGIGMDERTVASLFRPFAQAVHSLDRSRGGLGLGLAVARGIIELHGGQVEAHSDGLGKGSEFTLRLPTLSEWHKEQNEPRPAPGLKRRLRVLVIEDNRDVAETMQALLELLGHQASSSYDGESGVELAGKFAPDVVLCDLGLPGALCGFEVAKALRKQCSKPYLVAVTGYGGEQEKARALAAGFHRHMCKPIGAEALEELFASLPE